MSVEVKEIFDEKEGDDHVVFAAIDCTAAGADLCTSPLPLRLCCASAAATAAATSAAGSARAHLHHQMLLILVIVAILVYHIDPLLHDRERSNRSPLPPAQAESTRSTPTRP